MAPSYGCMASSEPSLFTRQGLVYVTYIMIHYMSKSRVERKTGNSNIFLKPLFRSNLDPFVNNANLGAIAHTSNGT